MYARRFSLALSLLLDRRLDLSFRYFLLANGPIQTFLSICRTGTRGACREDAVKAAELGQFQCSVGRQVQPFLVCDLKL